MVNGIDVFGLALLDYFEGNKNACLTVHAQGTASYEIPVAVFFRPADQLAIDQLALSHCTGRVLDIGAGTGIHSLYLQNQGLEITALDVSAHACQILSKSGISNVVEGDVF